MDRVKDPFDTRRCMATTARGQCWHIASEGVSYCRLHEKLATSERKKNLHAYQINRYSARLNQFAEHETLKSLTGEIAIARMTLETVMNYIEDPVGMLGQIPSIMQLITQIRATVDTAQRLEERNSLLLNRTQAQAFAQAVLRIVQTHVTDSAILEKIAMEIDREFASTGNEKDVDSGSDALND